MRWCFMAIFIWAFQFVSAQDLNGIWKGTLTQGAGGCYPQYFLELQISLENNVITGKAYDYYDTSKFVKLSFKGRLNPQTHRLVLTETKVLESNIPADCAPCIKTYDLVYSKHGSDEMMEGDWKGHLQGRVNTCPPGIIKLRKVEHSDFPIDIDQNDSLAAIQATIHLLPRDTQLLKTIEVDTSRIKIELYDDAIVDNDTISVFVNGKLLLYRQRLTEKPLTIYFSAFPDTPYELLMYADNLGLIPPNTALMMVTAGLRKFEVYLSSTEQKSAVVKFIYKSKRQ